MRSVNLHTSDEDLKEVITLTQSDSNVINGMLGRLSVWALDSYPRVDIYRDGSKDFVAIYRDATNPQPRFTLGAVWHEHEGKYGFHS